MGVQKRRKVIKLGNSRVISLPSQLEIGEYVTLAGNRILIVDPRGKISSEALLEFLEDKVEPLFWKWLEERGSNLKKKWLGSGRITSEYQPLWLQRLITLAEEVDREQQVK
jgi:antitoxin component of MazEF toxin-antitoxin module